MILDGWGHREDAECNAVLNARTPRLDALLRSHPATTLGASELAVGLPEGQMGNSEVGHLNLGAGRVVYQDFTRINVAIRDGSFVRNPALTRACDLAAASGGALHLLGLLSDGGVHSHLDHLCALLDLAGRRRVPRVRVHAFLDGRDTPPQSGLSYLETLESFLERTGVGRVATVGGRFYAMDRDHRWDRVEQAFRAIVQGEGPPTESAREAVRSAYAEGQTDEFVIPRVVTEGGRPVGPVADGDSVVFFNFRADRARELTRAFTEEGFDAFDVTRRPRLGCFVAFTRYDDSFDVPVAFPPQRLTGILGEAVSGAGLRQLRIAETEKYAHVTFFFNGGEEEPYPGEERILVPSPRGVPTYDHQPEMSAFGVRDRLLEEIEDGRFDFIVANFANLDMVGHTGVLEAAVTAAEAVDTCVGDVIEALRKAGYTTVVTADHGNAEEMWDPRSSQVHTAHTLNRVPFVLVDDRHPRARLRGDGILADVAPTVLGLMGLPVPGEMTGRSLLET